MTVAPHVDYFRTPEEYCRTQGIFSDPECAEVLQPGEYFLLKLTTSIRSNPNVEFLVLAGLVATIIGIVMFVRFTFHRKKKR